MRRRAIIGVLGTLALVVAIVAAGIAGLQTEAGGRVAARLLASLASTPGQAEIEIDAVEPGLPSRLGLRGLRLRDRDGQWLAVDRVVIDWRPLALLRGRVSVRNASVEGVRFDRLPTAGADESETTADGGLPSLPFDLALERFAFDGVRIGTAITGEPVTLQADGRLAAESAGRVETAARVVRTDGAGGEADLAATWVPATRTLTLDARLDEPEGGLIGAAVGLAGKPPVRLAVSGDGLLEDWRGRISGDVGEAVRLVAEMRTEPTPAGVAARAAGRADVAALLDEPFRALVADGVTFELALRRPDHAALFLDAVEVSTGGVHLSGDGLIDLHGGRIDRASLALSADAAAFGTLAPLLAPADLRGLEMEADISGPWAAPSVIAAGTVTKLQMADAAVDRIAWTTHIQPAEDPHGPTALNATAELLGLQAGATELAPMLGDDPRLVFEATLERTTNRLTLELARVETPNLALTGEGALDLASGDGEAVLHIAAEDLAAFGPATGFPLAGGAEFAIEASSNGGNRLATFSLETDGLQTGLGPLDAVLGSAPTLRGRVSADTSGRLVRLDETVLAGENLRFGAAGTLTDDALQATYEARIADLAPVAAAADLSAEGALAVDGTLSGNLSDPSIRANAVLENGRIATFAVSPAQLVIGADRLASAARGTLEVSAAVDGDPLRARIPFSVADNGAIELGPLDASAPGATAAGTLRLEAGGGPARGQIVVNTGAGGEAAGLANFTLAGESRATVRLDARGGEQTIDLDVDGRSLALSTPDGPAGGAETLSLHAGLAGAQGRFVGRVEASATAVATAGALVDRLDATLSGSADDANFTLAVRLPRTGGEGGEISGAGTMRRNGQRTQVVLRTLEGAVAGEALTLRRPLTVTVGDPGVALDDLDLAVGGGRVVGRGRTGTRGTDASLAVTDLPLTLAAAVRPDLKLAGTLNATSTLRSRGGTVSGDLALDLSDVYTAGMVPERAVDAHATARLDGGALTVEGTSEIAGRPLDLMVRVPARVDAQTLAVRLAPQAPVSGRLSWSGPVAELWELLPLSDQRLTGAAAIDLRLGGTVASPGVEGAVTLTDGRYENFVTATVIEEFTLSARADGRGAVALVLSGNDGQRGTIRGDGTVTLFGVQAPAAVLNLRMDEATLVRRDDVTATVSGTLDVNQSPSAARIGGRITTDRVEVRLLDRLPPSVVVLDVKEINLPPGRPRPRAEEPVEPVWRADLDLALRMPRRVFVRGRGLESEWEGDLRITGTTAAPILTGSVRARSGVFDFAGRRFTIERGVIGFAGGDSINPTVNVVAAREIADLTARIAVTGTATAPEIALSSQPALPDSEILSRVLFGEEVAQLGPVQLAQLGLALDTLAGGESLSEDALSYLRGLLGLDVLTVEAGTSDENDAAVGVGRYVADGVYVGARRGIEDESTAGTVEVEILPGLSVESEIGSSETGSTGALGLRWRWDY